jgi:hypothetical protein
MEIRKVGDVVNMDSYTTIGQTALAYSNETLIEKVDFRFDEKTGEKYPIYEVSGDWYDGRDGTCYSNKDSMYYIEFSN